MRHTTSAQEPSPKPRTLANKVPAATLELTDALTDGPEIGLGAGTPAFGIAMAVPFALQARSEGALSNTSMVAHGREHSLAAIGKAAGRR